MSVIFASPADRTGPSRPSSSTLYTLDVSCPIVLPSRATGSSLGWPITGHHIPIIDSNSDTNPTNPLLSAYLSTLFLPNILAPLSDFASCILLHSSNSITALLAPMLLTLPLIEQRHRRILLPLLSAITDGTSSPQVKQARVEEATLSSGLDMEECKIVETCIHLRMSSRVIADGTGVVAARKLAEGFERREVMIQTIMLLVYIQHRSSTLTAATREGDTTKEESEPKRKRRRKRDKDADPAPTPVDPISQPTEALELLFDRMAVWMAMADLNVDAAASGGNGAVSNALGKDKGKGREEEGVSGVLTRFWVEVIQPFFSSSLPDICASFHSKVFNTPLHPPSTKKPRKPQMTRAKPSSDNIPTTSATNATSTGSSTTTVDGPHGSAKTKLLPKELKRDRERSLHRIPSRSLSRAPSEISHTSHNRHSPPSLPTDMRRSASHTSHASASAAVQPDTLSRRRSRSRSCSNDPTSLDTRQESGYSGNVTGNGNKRNHGDALGAGGGGNGIGNGTGAGTLSRQPSAKDLFKGRQVGLMRRSASGVMRRVRDGDLQNQSQGQSQGQGQSQSQGQSQGVGMGIGHPPPHPPSHALKGLFGRKTSDPSKTNRPTSSTLPTTSTTSTAAQAHVSHVSHSETLIHATPSKPRYGNSKQMGAGRASGTAMDWQFSSGHTDRVAVAQTPVHSRVFAYHNQGDGYAHGGYMGWPTPIAEEPSSGGGGGGVGRRYVGNPSGVAETPVGKRMERGRDRRRGDDGNGIGNGEGVDETDLEDDYDEENGENGENGIDDDGTDSLGGLMVPTDDEEEEGDDDDDDGDGGFGPGRASGQGFGHGHGHGLDQRNDSWNGRAVDETKVRGGVGGYRVTRIPETPGR